MDNKHKQVKFPIKKNSNFQNVQNILYTCAHTHAKYIYTHILFMYVCTYAHMYTYVWVYMYVYVHEAR